MNPKVKYPDVINNELNRLKNAKNPNRANLLDLYNNVMKVRKHFTLKQVRIDFVEGKYISHLFEGAEYNGNLSLDEMKNVINRQLSNIKSSLPNLYNYLNTVISLDLKRITSLEQCNQLRFNLIALSSIYSNFHLLDKNWYISLSNDFEKNNYLKDSFKTYDTTSVELGFNKNLNNSNANIIKAYIKSEMELLRLNNPNLYNYYMEHVFNGAKSIDDYLTSFEKDLAPGQFNVQYQNLYNTIQDKFYSSKEILDKISGKDYNIQKIRVIVKKFEEDIGFKINNSNPFTKVLLKALINIGDYDLKFKLYDKLVSGIQDDGTILENVSNEIKREILNLLKITRDISNDEFEVLVDILNCNLDSNSRNLLLLDYVQIINNYYNEDNSHRSFSEYDKIRFEVLRYNVLAYKMVKWYNGELDILNRLLSLKCYGILNNILEAKLNNPKDNLFKDGYFDGGLFDKNSAEYNYKVLENVYDKNNHINVYYSVFVNHPDCFDNAFYFNGIFSIIDEDLDTLRERDPALFNILKLRYLNGFDNATAFYSSLQGDTIQKNDRIIDMYKNIYDYLGNWRDNSILRRIMESD